MRRPSPYRYELEIYSDRGTWRWRVVRHFAPDYPTAVMERSLISYDEIGRILLSDAQMTLRKWRSM